MRKIFFVLALICGLASSISTAWAAIEVRDDGDTCDVVLKGDITATDAERIMETRCSRAFLYLQNSPGGDVNAGMIIGRWARKHSAWITVKEESYCYSSCALVFIGGVNRGNIGKIGLHRPYLAGNPVDDADVDAASAKMYKAVQSYVAEMGISPEFFSVMFNTPPEAVRVFRGTEIESLVPRLDPFHDEREVARGARIYGITTSEFRIRQQEAEQGCDLTAIGSGPAWDQCKKAALWGLSESVYLRRDAAVKETCQGLRPLDVSGLKPLTPSKQDKVDQSWDEFQKCRIAVMQGRK